MFQNHKPIGERTEKQTLSLMQYIYIPPYLTIQSNFIVGQRLFTIQYSWKFRQHIIKNITTGSNRPPPKCFRETKNHVSYEITLRLKYNDYSFFRNGNFINICY